MRRPVSHRRLVATAAFIAAGVALLPTTAFADQGPHAPVPGAFTTSTQAKAVQPAASDLHHFSSPAKRSLRTQRAATAVRPADSTGNTIYVHTIGFCSPATGTGTAADPYCHLQDAVDAAQPGDTIEVQGDSPSQESVTVTTSDLSIVGVGNEAGVTAAVAYVGKPALILDHVSDVKVSNLMLTSWNADTVHVVGSTGITLDSDYVDQGAGDGHTTLTIDGTSSGVTVSRTYLNASSNSGHRQAVSVAPGAADITLAADVLAASGIAATGVQGLNVTNDTIQRGCDAALDVEGASTGVSIENNLFEDTNPTTDIATLETPSGCADLQRPWVPDVTVSADSAAGTTADYNAFHVYGSDATAPYGWAGTAYATLDDFRSGTQQGAHDLDDPVQAGTAALRIGQRADVDMLPKADSAVNGSADPDAPGRPDSDFYGVSPFDGRGAVEFVNHDPNLAVALSGEDTSAYGISLDENVTGTPTSFTMTTDWGDGSAPTVTKGSTAGTYSNQHVYQRLGDYTVSVTVTDSDDLTTANTVQVRTAGSSYHAYGPTRLLDTRNGTGAPQAKVAAHGTVRLKVGGNGGIPADASAVVLNLTVTGASAGGHITAYPDGGPLPTTSNVNFSAARTVPNLSIVPVGAGGYVDLYNSSGGTLSLIADADGYFTQSAGANYQPLAPYRLADTRNGTGTPKRKLAPHTSIALQVAGADKGKLPSSGISAVALNVTVADATSSGVITAYPDGVSTPVASNLNFVAGKTIANAVVTPVGSDGKIRIYLSGTQSADVIVDVSGYYSASAKGAYLPTDPTRLLDTRDTSMWPDGPLDAGDYISMPIFPDQPDITGVVLNATVTNTKSSGHLGVAPDPNSLDDYDNGTAVWPPTPTSSTLNWQKGATVPNLVQAGLGGHGIVDFWNQGTGSIALVVDAFGFYQTD